MIRRFRLREGETARLIREQGEVLLTRGVGWVSIDWEDTQPPPLWLCALALLRGYAEPADMPPDTTLPSK